MSMRPIYPVCDISSSSDSDSDSLSPDWADQGPLGSGQQVRVLLPLGCKVVEPSDHLAQSRHFSGAKAPVVKGRPGWTLKPCSGLINRR